MEEPGFEADFLSGSRVAIWGLGLMGGSLAMALKGKCASVVGIDSDPETVALAKQMGIVDAASVQPDGLVEESDLIVLATPVRAILWLLSSLPDHCPQPAVVIDLGSTKNQVMRAMQDLPERFDPIGGHPMCGKEKSSLLYAGAALYQGAPFALVALERTSARARQLAMALVVNAGAQPLWLNADEHDRWVAATSHAPYLLASALAGATPGEVKPMVGPGFRSSARLAGSSTGMMMDILTSNSDNIRIAIEGIAGRLKVYDDLLAQGDYESLAELLNESGDRYRYLIENGRGDG